jgi:HD-GYP domain-containing protein (c-di-GMP phosphodiesterase class II)
MRQIAIERVVPGMVNARHVYPPGETSGLPLLAAQVTVTEAIKDRLVRSGVLSICIDDELSKGIENIPPITDEVRRGAISTVHRSFAALRKSDGVLPPDQIKEIETTINAIMAEIGNRQNLLVCLSDLNRFGGDRMQHAINVCVVGCAIGQQYFQEQGWRDFRGQRRMDQIPDRLQKLGIGLMLQDVGALSIPEEVWDKRGMLTSEERALVQSHPLLGVELLKGSDISPLVTVTIAQHHERYDGSGYPKGLVGDEIHDHGQIAAIAEAYVTLTNKEMGAAGGEKKKLTAHAAYNLVLQAGGKMFHPVMVKAFSQAIAPYGPGTSVLLSDGSSAIVVKNHPTDPLMPVVRVTHDPSGTLVPGLREVDLAADPKLEITDALDGLPSDATPVASAS